MAEDLLQRAVSALDALGPWPAAGGVALAVSGGADSVFLAHAWCAFACGRGWPARALVVDHGRRPSSAAEAARAAAAMESLGLPARVLAAEVRAPGEDGLRRARYAALATAMADGGESVLLTGHQADDQAETVLLRMLRGTGLRGLAGMPPRRQLAPGRELRRPLLGLRRAEIRAWLAGHGVACIEDPSNDDAAAAARNRLRLEILPAAAALGAGDPVPALLRLGEEAAECAEACERIAARAADWRELPSYLRRLELARCLRALDETVSPARLRDLEAALLARGRAGLGGGRELRLSAQKVVPTWIE